MKRVGILIFTFCLVYTSPGLAQTKMTLGNALRLSADHSASVKSSYYDSLAAVYDLSAAKALRWPTISTNAVAYYIDDVQSVTIAFRNMTVGSHDNYQIDSKLTLPIYTGGRISNQIKIQQELAGARSYNLGAERSKNAYMTRRAYLGLLAAEAVAAASEASIGRVRLINQDVHNLYSSGLADSINILEAELSLERALGAMLEREAAVSNAKANLARLVGLPPDNDIALADSLPIPDTTIYQNKTPNPLAIERPELQILEKRALAAKYSRNLSSAYYLPTLSGYGGYSTGKPNKSFLDSKWNDYWTAGLTFNWEFNLGGKIVYSVRSAAQAAKSAEMAKNDLAENLTLGANIALENLKMAYRNYVISVREYEIAKNQYRHGLNQEQAGRLSVNRLLELETDLTSQEQLYRAQLVNYFLAETEYFYAIGSSKIFGGF
jgi:OMF family outer membrane factor